MCHCCNGLLKSSAYFSPLPLPPSLPSLSPPSSEIEILYGGSNIFDYEFTAAIINDAVLASISGGLILLLVWFLSGFSAWLTLGGLYAIVSCFIPAYFAYRTVFSKWPFS